MSKSKKIFLTGSFGNAGEQILIQLLSQKFSVVCFDVKTVVNVKKEKKLASKYSFETVWGDLREAADLKRTIEQYVPDVIIHNAAIIPPVAFLNPKLSYAVNVNGTQNLIDAILSYKSKPKFIFISSYSVHGSQNPYKNNPLLTGDSPVNPGDNYGKQKVECEKRLKASNLPWTIIRFPAVFGIDPSANQHPATMRFSFLLPSDRKEHAIDVRDAALAVANAVEAKVNNKTFDIGGDKTWKKTAGELMKGLFEVRGLKPLPASAYRKADPEADESWYYEGWIDTEPSEKVLNYQKHSFEDYLLALKKELGFQRHIIKLLSPLIQKKLLKDSPYYGKPEKLDSRPFWESLCSEFDIDIDDSDMK